MRDFHFLFVYRPILDFGNYFDFDQGILGERLDGYGRACREGCRNVLGIEFVECGKVAHVGHEDSHLDEFLHAAASCFYDGFAIAEALLGLATEVVSGQSSCGWVDAQLSACINEVVDNHSLAVCADSGRSVGGRDNLFHIFEVLRLIFGVMRF